MLPYINGEFRAAADPELRFAPSGVAVGKIRAVASKRKKNENDEWVDDKNCWVNVTCFKQLAENIAESIQKGDLFVVSGTIETDDWEDRDGNKRTSINVIANNIGPSLAYATARVAKTERRQNDGGGQRQATRSTSRDDNDPWGTSSNDDSGEPPF